MGGSGFHIHPKTLSADWYSRAVTVKCLMSVMPLSSLDEQTVIGIHYSLLQFVSDDKGFHFCVLPIRIAVAVEPSPLYKTGTLWLALVARPEGKIGTGRPPR